MKQIWKFLTIAVILSACMRDHTPSVGVSRELAAERFARIHQLKYQLNFSIPAALSDPVLGRNTISFDLTDWGTRSGVQEDLWLDFTGSVQSLMINHQEVAVEQRSEHLRLPGKYLATGKNHVEIKFTAPDQSLNRREDYLYTLLVPDRARTLFPCFDQPDLKATFALRLSVPQAWQAIANGPNVAEADDHRELGKKIIRFAPTEPLSTYLFSFVAGDFQYETFQEENRSIRIYYRESNPDKLTQLPQMAREVFASLNWLEQYTQIPYPFAKYDLIIVPGFQYGGMEHTGATLYNDQRMFLEPNPSMKERMARTSLIAHETAHMWFGDYVTMSWFDDVWVKEIFANYFAAQMVRESYPDYDDRLNFSSYHVAAYSEDRTTGAVSLDQSLSNLKDAGLIYSNIVYNKAPVVLNMLVDKMGAKAFQRGIQTYLRQYAYGNASWADLIDVLDSQVSVDLIRWSDSWVSSSGMPHYEWERLQDTLEIRQVDPWGREQLWDQSVRYAWVEELADGRLRLQEERLLINREVTRILLPASAGPVLPNSDAMAYGLFKVDESTKQYWMDNLSELQDPMHRRALLTNFQELYWNGDLHAAAWAKSLLDCLWQEENQLLFTQLLNQLSVLSHWHSDLSVIEQTLQKFCEQTTDPVKQRMIYLALLDMARTSQVRTWLLERYQSSVLSPVDATQAVYRLCLYFPHQAAELLQSHRLVLTHPDRIAEFDFVSRAVHPDPVARQAFFEDLLEPANRTIEPWVIDALELLCHRERQQEALSYLRKGLEELPEIQQTGDIFFPKTWCGALLSGHTSDQARKIVLDFLDEAEKSSDTSMLHPLIISKIRQQAYPLLSQRNL
ncbi:MAG: aminopeptidase [Bacteroidales bacterium]|nr:aminopeptidase [Bacteroidales bacterium]